MYNYSYLKDFKDFNSVNESLTNGSQSVCNQAFINGGIITFSDGNSVHPKEIVKVCDDAINELAEDFSRTFKFVSRINIIFLRESSRIKTMAVDKNMNMYINASFVYHTLQMNKEYVGAVIMHEVFHVLYDHIQRGSNWVAAQGKALTPQLHHDNNLAADIEVNQTLVRLGVISAEDLTNTINGLYLRSLKKEGSSTDIIPMETILENEEYMTKLRNMCPPPVDPDKQQKQPEIKTTEDWNKGYKEGWNKIASIIKKYGYKGAWDVLLKEGIVNGAGEINMKKDIADITSLEFLQVKSYEDFINESFNEYGNKKDVGQTYENGFTTGISKLISKLYSAINPQEGMNGGGEGGQILDTDLKPDDLDQVNLPLPETDGGGNGGEKKKGVPENINNTNKNKKSEKPQENKNNSENKDKREDGKQNSSGQEGDQGSGQGTGGEGKSDDELTDDDKNKLIDDLKNKPENSGNNINSSDDELSGIGGTGSYIDDNNYIGDDILKESGYLQEDIDAINEIRQKNKERNSKTGIEKAKQEMRNSLREGGNRFMRELMDKIEISASKYKNIWKEIMEDFMSKKTRRSGNKINDTSINWKRKSRIALGTLGPQYQKVDQDPQDVNIYVDVSGSVDIELLEIISKSLVEFSKMYKYSGMNICPWASTNNGIHPVDEFSHRSEDEVTKEILQIVSKGISQCGGGTDGNAAIAAMVDVVVNTLNNSKKKRKDDVHVVITDGEFDNHGIEKRIEGAVFRGTDNDRAAETAPEHTFWMIYDASEKLRNDWKNEIKRGELIFINSDTVKANG